MIRCPVCEHSQAVGDSCELCGRNFGVSPVNVQVVALLDLERTRHEDEPDWMTPPMPDLERTPLVDSRSQPAPLSVAATTATPAAAARVGPGAGQGAGGAVTCRYCQNVQEQGALCDRCGMRLTRRAGARPSVPGKSLAAARRGLEPVRTRCRACGAPALGGHPCGDCGRPVPVPDP